MTQEECAALEDLAKRLTDGTLCYAVAQEHRLAVAMMICMYLSDMHGPTPGLLSRHLHEFIAKHGTALGLNMER